MKSIWKYIASALALPLLAVACTTDYPEPNEKGLPQASDFDIAIDVDQETNYATFTLNNRGMIPMWIFGEEKIDGSANKKYAYAQNGLRLRFRDAKEYSVEVKAYNVNGISIGSKVVTFAMENEYRDPFNETPYKNAVSNNGTQEWIWNSSVDGHFGCGEPGSDGLNWWSAKADEKADWSLYNDVMTFSADGTYTYDPGEDGMVYVNAGSGYKAEYLVTDGEDYLVPIEKFDAQYHFEQSWNDAGIEEIYLCLDEGANVSYIPFQAALDTPRYKLLETSTSALRREIKMCADDGSIAWHYDFVPAGGGEEADEMFNGIGFSNGMVETDLVQGDEIPVKGIDLSAIWVDPDFFTYVDASTLKFNAVDGEYRVIWNGKWLKVLPLKNGEPATYENAGALWIIGDGGGKPSLSNLIGWTTENALPCARIDATTYRITLYMDAKGTIKVYGQNNWGQEWKQENYGTIEGNGLFDIPNEDGNIAADGATAGLYTFTFVDNDGTLDMSVEAAEPVGPTLFDPESAANVWPTDIEPTFWFADAGWSQIADPECTHEGRTYTLTMDNATEAQWQGQFTLTTADLSTSADKYYDFSISITCTKDHPGVTIKLTQADDDDTFYFADRHEVFADEELLYQVGRFPGKDIPALKLALDFGGCEAGTVATIKDILFQEHQTGELK